MFRGDFLIVSSNSDAPDGQNARLLEASEQVSISFGQKVWLGDHTLGAVQAPVGCDSDVQIVDVGLSKEVDSLLFRVELDKNFSRLEFFKASYFSPRMLCKNFDIKNAKIDATGLAESADSISEKRQ